MLGCLMDIRDKLMNSSEKYTLIPVHALADDVADFACEVSELTKYGREKLGSIVCLISQHCSDIACFICKVQHDKHRVVGAVEEKHDIRP